MCHKVRIFENWLLTLRYVLIAKYGLNQFVLFPVYDIKIYSKLEINY